MSIKKQTTVEYLVDRFQQFQFGLIDVEQLKACIRYAKQKEQETKQFWFGRGILAHKEKKIKQLKP